MWLQFLTICIIISLGTIGVLSFWSMSNMDHTAGSGCPILTMFNEDCFSISGALSSVGHHMSSLQSLMSSIVAESSELSLLPFLFSFVIVLFFVTLIYEVPPDIGFSYKKYRFNERPIIITEARMFRWFVLNNKRDPHTLRWMYEIT